MSGGVGPYDALLVVEEVARQGVIPRPEGLGAWILGAHTAGMALCVDSCSKGRVVGMKAVGSEEYLSVDQLAGRIPYKPKTIRNLLSRGVFIEGIHFTRLTGRPIFLWSRVEQLLREGKNGRKGQG